MRLIMHADGGCWPNPGQSYCGVVVRDERGVLLDAIRKNLGQGTNNTAEWGALITALESARERKATHVLVLMDSMLVVRQANGRWRVKSRELKPLHERAVALARELAQRGCEILIQWVPREQNTDADALTEQRA